MRQILSCWLFTILPFTCQAQDWKLWYNFPAREWEEALPVCNVRLGAMVFGTVDRERISLNEETIFYLNYQT
jgi:alpha-L-fucosidase 2